MVYFKETLLKDFKLNEMVSNELIREFKKRIPEQLLAIWEKYDFGSILSDYLKIVNPLDYHDLLKETYVRSDDALVLFTTSMGDFIVWEDSRYLLMLNYRNGKVKGISSRFNYFLQDLVDDDLIFTETLDWHPYPAAVQKYGEPAFDECFGYVPLLGLGGPEKVENLQKVKLKEHILLISEFMGPIE